jgi:mRNA-degrading endonuclease toxin of MazEF toxin-antitoxin module
LSEEAYPPGSVVLVPFPFTDLSGRKRRPALVVSPEGFHDEDLILCAITSQLPERFFEWEISLESGEMVEEKLPKKSVIKVGKLFTMHRNLIARRFGTVKEQKLQEILSKLRTLFSRPKKMADVGSEGREIEGDLRTEEVDEAVLALLYLNAFEDHGQLRSWKTFDWDAMDRLHERGLIGDPKSKAKSVPLTADGFAAAKESFHRRFARR